MTRRMWRDLGALILAAVPLLLWAYTASLSMADVRHTPIEVARVYRVLLFIGITSAGVAAALSFRSWLAARTNVLAVATIIAAVAFLIWALPLAWGVLGAIIVHGDV